MSRGWTFLFKVLGKWPFKNRNLASKSIIVMNALAHMLDLGWLIYTSKHRCVYSLIRWEKRGKGKTLGQCLYIVSLLFHFDQTISCSWRKQPLYSSVPFLHTPMVVRSGYFPGFLFSSLLFHLHEEKRADNLSFLWREWRCSCVFIAKWSFLLFLHPNGQSWIQQTPSEEVFHWDEPATK